VFLNVGKELVEKKKQFGEELLFAKSFNEPQDV
jgi:hypothetical protein